MGKKLKRMNPNSRTYRDREARLAFEFVPPIHPCENCGNPKAYGYVCHWCHDDEKNVEPKRTGR